MKVSHILYASNEQLETKRQNLVIAPKGKKKNREILAHYSNKTYTRVYAGNCKMSMQELKEGTASTNCKTQHSTDAISPHPDRNASLELPWHRTTNRVGGNHRNGLSSGRQKCQQGQLALPSGTCLASSGFQGLPTVLGARWQRQRLHTCLCCVISPVCPCFFSMGPRAQWV